MNTLKSSFNTSQKIWFSIVGLAFLLYAYYLVFHFRITASSIMSAIIALIIPLLFSAGLYYLAYRWAFPKLCQKAIHQWIIKIIIALQFSTALSVWFIQNQPFPVWLLNTANRYLPLFSGNSSAYDLSTYFPLVTFLSFNTMVTIIFLLLLLLAEKFFHLSPTQLRKMLSASYFFLLLSVTTCVYSTDFMQIAPGRESKIWYGGTEDYVNFRIENASLSFIEDLQQYGGFLYGRDWKGEQQVYLSGTGFYASILKLIQSITNQQPQKLLENTRIFCAFLTAGMLTALSYKIKKKISLIASLVFSFLALITFWLMGPASHLIWFFPVLLIPFSISTFIYPFVMNKKWSYKKFLLFCTIGYVLVFLRSYVYTPVMTLSGAIPVFFYEINRRENWKTILWRCIQVCLTGVFGFMVVLLIHIIQLWFYFGNLSEAADLLIFKAVFRGTGGDTNLQTPLEIFQKWLTVPVFYISKHIYAIFPQWEEPIKQINTLENLHLFSFGSVILAGLMLAINNSKHSGHWLNHSQARLLFSLSLTTVAALLSSWSWFPALGHMSHHYHMNGIMYMIPFGLTAFMLFGVLVEYSIQMLLKPRS